jgi:hypothetical protein
MKPVAYAVLPRAVGWAVETPAPESLSKQQPLPKTEHLHHHVDEPPKTVAERLALGWLGSLLLGGIAYATQQEEKSRQLNGYSKRFLSQTATVPLSHQGVPASPQQQAALRHHLAHGTAWQPVRPNTLLKAESSAIFSKNPASWLKALGLVSAVQSLNAAFGIQLPPSFTALEMGAIFHTLLPGRIGFKAAHFATMAPLLAGSALVGQQANKALEHQADHQEGWSDTQRQLAKSGGGLVFSLGLGVAAMALFPRVHLGLASAPWGRNARGENWYLRTMKGVDGLANAVYHNGAWRRGEARLGQLLQAPWRNPHFYAGEEAPEAKVYKMAKAKSNAAALFGKPVGLWQTVAWCLNPPQTAVAKAFFKSEWQASGALLPHPSMPRMHHTPQQAQRYEALWHQRDALLHSGQPQPQREAALAAWAKTLSPLDERTLVAQGSTCFAELQHMGRGHTPWALTLAKEALPTVQPAPLAPALRPLVQQAQAALAGPPHPHSSFLASDYVQIKPVWEALNDHFELEEPQLPQRLEALRQHPSLALCTEEQKTAMVRLYRGLNEVAQPLGGGDLQTLAVAHHELKAQLGGFYYQAPSTWLQGVGMAPRHQAQLGHAMGALLKGLDEELPQLGTASFLKDLQAVQRLATPLEALNEAKAGVLEALQQHPSSLALVGAKPTDKPELIWQRCLAHALQQQGMAEEKSHSVAALLSTIPSTVEHIKGHIPAVSNFWSLTGAEAGAVSCGNGCCSGSFFCITEAAALVGSLLSALGLGKAFNTPPAHSEANA